MEERFFKLKKKLVKKKSKRENTFPIRTIVFPGSCEIFSPRSGPVFELLFGFH